MRRPCDYSDDGKDWQSGWIIGFVFNSIEELTYGIIEHESGGLSEVPRFHIRTKLEPIK